MKNIKKCIFLPILLLFITVPVAGQEITLDRCHEMALENNKQMAIAKKTKTKADLTIKSMMANFLPTFYADGMYLFSSSSFTKTLEGNYLPTFVPDPMTGELIPNILTMLPDGSPVFKEYAYFPDMSFDFGLNGTLMAGINVEQPIYMGGKIRSAYKISKIGGEIAALNMDKTESEIILETERAYWTYVQTIELSKSARKYKETVEEFHRVVKNAVEAGMKSRNDLMKVQVELNQALLQLQRAENGTRLARMNLCQMIGLPLMSNILPAQSFDDLPNIVDLDGDISHRPEYSILTKQIELKESEKRLVASDYLPSLGVRGSYNYTYGLKINDTPLFDNGGFSAIVSLKIPIFHWGEGSRKIKRAQSETNVARLQRDDLSEKMHLEVRQAINLYNEQLLEVELTQIALDQAEENLRMSRDYYEAGMETISDYLQAQTIYQSAQSEQIIARTKLEIAKAEYKKAVGIR